MKILQWIFPFVSSRGGRENFVLNLARDQVMIGDEVRVLGLDPADEHTTRRSSEHDGWPIEVIGLGAMLAGRQGVMQQLLTELEELVDEFRPDVIHNHNTEGPDLLMLRAVAKKFEVPVVTTIHGPLLTPSAAAQSRIRLLRQVSTRIVCISESSRTETLKNYPELRDELQLVVNGIPDLGVDAKNQPLPNRIYASGRFSPEKGFAQLIAALAMVRQVIPDVELVLAGDGPDSRILPKYAETLGIADRVVFPGWLSRTDSHRELARSSLVVVPSVWEEPFGLVAVEAMLAGKPVIATNRGELANIVQHDQTGLLFDSGDVIGLAARIRLLLEQQALAQKLGIEGRRRALEHYGQRRCTLQYQNQYLAAQGRRSNFSAIELGEIGSSGDWRVFPQDLGILLQDANRLSEVIDFKGRSKVPAVFKVSHDDPTPLPAQITENAAVFRVSMLAGQTYQNEFPLPTLISGEEFESWTPAPHTERARVGFVGQAQHEVYHRAISNRAESDVSQVGYELIESTNALLRTPINIGLVLRKRALAVLEKSELVETEFLVRDSYHFQGKLQETQTSTRQDFLESLRTNPYSLCIRGAGNYSIRLYETLAAGRIPIILNSSLVLPLPHLIDWRNIGVWVELDQLDQMDHLVAEFHGALSPLEFVEKQSRIRATWEQFLSPANFWRQAMAALDEVPAS